LPALVWISGGKAEDFYRYDPRAVHRRLLEYATAVALRMPLAGPLKFVAAFCNGVAALFAPNRQRDTPLI
jgi:hypothetical protein